MDLICRTCLKKVDKRGSANLATNQEIRKQLAVCIPEVVIDCVKDPVICNLCVVLLKTSYDFTCQVLKIEERIIDYKNSNVYDVDLNKLVTSENTVNDDLNITNWRVANFIQQYNRNQVFSEKRPTKATTMAPNTAINYDLPNEKVKETAGTFSARHISNAAVTIQSEERQTVVDEIKEESLDNRRDAITRRKSCDESLLRRPHRKRRRSVRYGDDYFINFSGDQSTSTWDSASSKENHSSSSEQPDIKVKISDSNAHNEQRWQSSIFFGKNCKVVLTKLSLSTIQNFSGGKKRGRKSIKKTKPSTPRKLLRRRHTTCAPPNI